jgi:uncharacterized protein YktA (UPF0223 family)
MEFNLPQDLSKHLISYDPLLRKEIKKQRSANRVDQSDKPRYPLGLLQENLFPEEVVSTASFRLAVENINAENAPERYRRYSKVVANKDETYAIFYNYQNIWVAAWLPPEDNKDQYLYGFSYAIRDTAKNLEAVERLKKQTGLDPKVVVVKRSNFLVFTKLMTKEDVVRMHTGLNTSCYFWKIADYFTYKRGNQISRLCNQFTESVRNTLLTWKSSYGNIFDRTVDSSSFIKLLDMGKVVQNFDKNFIDDFQWVPSFENYIQIVKLAQNAILNSQDRPYSVSYALEPYKKFKTIPIFEKPFFKKWIQERCDEVRNNITIEENDSKELIVAPWNQILNLANNIDSIINVWPNCPIDYFQTHVNILSKIEHIMSDMSSTCVEWLNTNMPVASFFQCLSKYYEKAVEKNDHYGIRRFTTWMDTTNMLTKLIAKAPDSVPIPKRWRLDEFHDLVQAESWKHTHEDKALPQDLFPNPVKILSETYVFQPNTVKNVLGNDVVETTGKTTWTFFQPSCLHQLAAWGQAVRNCVGNASSYAEGVVQKKHFIVLAMVDNKPKFTVQLEVNNGVMSVRQIVGMHNSGLTPDDKQQYTKMFGQALDKRNEEVAAVQ